MLPTSVSVPPAPGNHDPAWLASWELPPPERELLSSCARSFVLPPAGADPVVRTAAEEWARFVQEALGRAPTPAGRPAAGALVMTLDPSLPAEGFRVRHAEGAVDLAGGSGRGLLYGVFALARELRLGRLKPGFSWSDQPASPLRQINHWDNLEQTVERGYAGGSLFDWRRLPELDPRLRDYARLLASLGINGIALNNVNADPALLTPEYAGKIAALDGLFRAWGIDTYIAVNFAAPMLLDKLPTADPLDPGVAAWWRERAARLHRRIPGFGGFLVKASSEGQPGPLEYGRSHADAANMLARALAPHGGQLIYRAFVYKLDGSDRASMACDGFMPLDGLFDDNVIIQIKNGPLDFQVREAVSPLLGRMPRTHLMLELQITQEYLGHATHACFLAPQWRAVLDFDLHAEGPGSTVSRLVAGGWSGRDRRAGIAAVANVGDDAFWTGHPLAQANWYAFGRLAWRPELSSRDLAEEWTRQSYGPDPLVNELVPDILLRSYPAYEAYTSNLGMNYLCDRARHYDPMPEIRTGYHCASATGVGYDRTCATGSGYAGQYAPPVARRFESPETCPEELLLWFHHVPYTRRLASGKTLIQHIYDQHHAGVAEVAAFRGAWERLQGRLPPAVWRECARRLEAQEAHARVWCRTINAYFARLSGIPDERADERGRLA
jgi:alpha-glucuronidase